METMLIGIILTSTITLFGFIAVHRLSVSREKKARYAAACGEFRRSIMSSKARVPPAHEHWENSALEEIPAVRNEIETAVVVFSPHVSSNSKGEFEEKWRSLEILIENKIPKAVPAAEIIHRGGSFTASKTKEQFHQYVNDLLEYAKET